MAAKATLFEARCRIILDKVFNRGLTFEEFVKEMLNLQKSYSYQPGFPLSNISACLLQDNPDIVLKLLLNTCPELTDADKAQITDKVMQCLTAQRI